MIRIPFCFFAGPRKTRRFRCASARGQRAGQDRREHVPGDDQHGDARRAWSHRAQLLPIPRHQLLQRRERLARLSQPLQGPGSRLSAVGRNRDEDRCEG